MHKILEHAVPRTVREVTLATRTARLRLPLATKPLWRELERGLHLGYRRRKTGGSWIARRRTEKHLYREGRLGLADDFQDADGEAVLDFSQAQAAARTWWRNEMRIEQGLGVREVGPYTVARACADYLDDYNRRSGKGTRTIDNAFRNHVLPVFGDLLVSKLTSRAVQDWHRRIAEQPRRLRSRKGQPPRSKPIDLSNPEAVRVRRATANRILSFFKAALNHAWKEQRVLSDDPWRRVKPFRAVDAPKIRYLDEAEIIRLLSSCEGRFRDLVHAALLTGCRYGEMCRFKVGDYDPRIGVLSVLIAKGGKGRHVTLTDEGVALLDRLVAGRSASEVLFQKDTGPWEPCDQVRRMQIACAKACVVAVGFHILRHTHASHLAMRGVPLAVIAKQLGHADTRMTERHYAHLAPNYIAETIRASFPRLLPPKPADLVELRPAQLA